METSDAVKLIKHHALVTSHVTEWADLGCGAGFFTNVLSSFLTRGSTIYAADSAASVIKKVRVASGIILKTFVLDFIVDEWPFDKLDGIMMANSLHYVRDKDVFIEQLKEHLQPNGSLLIVEYDLDAPNAWVPYPVTFQLLEKLFVKHGFASVEKINQMPSAFGRANMYSALLKQ